MTTITYPLTGLHCKACVAKVTQALSPLADSVAVSLEPMQVTLTQPHASVEQLQAAVAGVGSYVLKPNTPVVQVNTAQAATENIADSDTKSWLATYYPLLLILAYILTGSVLVQLGQHAQHSMDMSAALQAITAQETMRYFMAGFFIVFSFFKLLDVPAFAMAYSGYDLLAARWQGWGTVYPFVELGLGMAYLLHWQPVFTHWLTIVVMGFSAIGVVRAVLQKRSIQCACLGTVFQLPMSTVTIVEDVGMVLMATIMLVTA
jgi:copper chaperone CopZ